MAQVQSFAYSLLGEIGVKILMASCFALVFESASCRGGGFLCSAVMPSGIFSPAGHGKDSGQRTFRNVVKAVFGA